jgi:hypothetical protein
MSLPTQAEQTKRAQATLADREMTNKLTTITSLLDLKVLEVEILSRGVRDELLIQAYRSERAATQLAALETLLLELHQQILAAQSFIRLQQPPPFLEHPEEPEEEVIIQHHSLI